MPTGEYPKSAGSMSETALGQQAGDARYLPNSLQKAIAELKGEMVTVFICTELPSQRLGELKQQAAVLEG
jgi:hypothetical protein